MYICRRKYLRTVCLRNRPSEQNRARVPTIQMLFSSDCFRKGHYRAAHTVRTLFLFLTAASPVWHTHWYFFGVQIVPYLRNGAVRRVHLVCLLPLASHAGVMSLFL